MFIIAWIIESILTTIFGVYMWWRSSMNRLSGMKQKKSLPIIDSLLIWKMKKPKKFQLTMARSITMVIKKAMDYKAFEYMIIYAMQKKVAQKGIA